DSDGHSACAVAARVLQHGLQNPLRQVALDTDPYRMCRPLDRELETACRYETRTCFCGLRRDRVCIRGSAARTGLVARSRDERVDGAGKLLCAAAYDLECATILPDSALALQREL